VPRDTNFWQSELERDQGRMNATLWERPDLYLESSSILHADQVTTPLLLFHTDLDELCLFYDAEAFFVALRSLGKKVWMLEYEGQVHSLRDEDTATVKDFTTRLIQFFDYYLKGAPPPKWMTEGVPARLKGIETGLDLDTSGQVP